MFLSTVGVGEIRERSTNGMKGSNAFDTNECFFFSNRSKLKYESECIDVSPN